MIFGINWALCYIYATHATAAGCNVDIQID